MIGTSKLVVERILNISCIGTSPNKHISIQQTLKKSDKQTIILKVVCLEQNTQQLISLSRTIVKKITSMHFSSLVHNTTFLFFFSLSLRRTAV